MQVELLDVASLEAGTWTRFYDDVLATSFPPDELMTAEEMAPYRSTDADIPGIVALEGADPVAGILGEYFPDSRTVLICYLACRPDRRNLGIGSRLLANAVPRWYEAVDPITMVLEVEDSRYHTSARYGDPLRRLRFYARAGARLVDVPYMQPSLRAGMPRVRDMLLLEMGRPAAGDDMGGGEDSTLPADTLTAFLAEYFEGTEGPQVADDPSYRELLEQARSAPEGRIHLLPPGAWPVGVVT